MQFTYSLPWWKNVAVFGCDLKVSPKKYINNLVFSVSVSKSLLVGFRRRSLQSHLGFYSFLNYYVNMLPWLRYHLPWSIVQSWNNLVSHPGSSRTATSMQLTLEVVLWVGEVTWQIRTLPALPEELNSIFTTHTVEYNNLQLQFQVIWHHFLGFEDTT